MIYIEIGTYQFNKTYYVDICILESKENEFI